MCDRVQVGLVKHRGKQPYVFRSCVRAAEELDKNKIQDQVINSRPGAHKTDG